MNHYRHHRIPVRRSPDYARVGPLLVLAVVAVVVGAPFYWLWHPLGQVIAVVLFLLLWLGLLLDSRRRPRPRDGAYAYAKATVRR